MDVKLIGIDDNSPEFQSGQQLKELFENSFKQLRGKIYIKPNLTLLGSNAEQLDLLVWGNFEGGFTTPYNLAVTPKDQLNEFQPISKAISSKVTFDNFFLVIEVKDHDSNKIKTLGTDLYVRYSKGRYDFDWHNASEQSKSQVHSVRRGLLPYLNKLKIDDKYCPQVSNLIWLRNLNRENVQNLELKNLLPSTFESRYFFQTIAKINPPVGIKSPRVNFIRGRVEGSRIDELMMIFFESFEKEVYLKSGILTRKKLEEVIQQQINIEEKPYFNEIGEKLIIIKGEPGSGKTIHLFQIAYSLYTQQNKRCLLLTYNKALEADLGRLSYLSGVNTDAYNPTVKIQTIQSFFYHILIAYDLFKADPSNPSLFLDNYGMLLANLDEIVEADWIDEAEKNKIKRDVVKFNWDIILIDESQDWLELERDILFKLFEPQNFVIAYGDRQFVRQAKGINWTEFNRSVNKLIKIETYNPQVNLKKTFRQKKNIVEFQNRLFDDYSWKLKINNDLLGGNVSIYTNPFAKIDLETILKKIKEENCAPFDLLMLMPRSYYNEVNQLSTFKEWGFEGINGIDKIGKILNNDVNKFRCFQYESCRGLEAWVVVCHWFDEFLQNKFDNYNRDISVQSSLTDEEAKMKHASDWAFLATSRAIDHLIITVKDKNSKFGKILFNAGNKNLDFTILD